MDLGDGHDCGVKTARRTRSADMAGKKAIAGSGNRQVGAEVYIGLDQPYDASREEMPAARPQKADGPG